MNRYQRLCPVCGTAENADATQCGHCGTLLLGVDLTLREAPPAAVAPATPAPETSATAAVLACPQADCGMPNPAGATDCLYCGRPLAASAPVVSPAPTFYRLPDALAAKFRIAEVLPAGGAEAEIMILEGLTSQVRVVAKLYRPGLMPKPEVLERVSQAAFRHVVKLLAWGESDGVGYEVMEYCPAGSLRRLMETEERPLRRDLLRDALAEIAAALAALHALGVIHRDLKPENILVRRRAPLDLVLADFGIASVANATQLFTSTARTVKYGAPETLAGIIDPAADWWSLGLVLVELLTGQHPFDGLSDAVVTHRLVTATLDCAAIDDPEWRMLCRGLLLRDPARRWGSDEVRRWLAGDATLVPPAAETVAPLTRAARPYRLETAVCTTPVELAVALAGHWDAGRKDLVRGQLSAWIGQELQDDNLLRFTQDLLDLRDVSDDLRLFRLLRQLAPAMPPVWRGVSLRLPALLAQAARAAQGDAAAADWLLSVFGQRMLRELPAAQHPEEAAFAARWESARARVDHHWQATTPVRQRWHDAQHHRNGVADFDALVFGQPQHFDAPPPLRLHPHLVLALADAASADALRAEVRQGAEKFAGHAPWLAALLADDGDIAAWLVARQLLPLARDTAAAALATARAAVASAAAERTAFVARTNLALVQLREACDLGWLAGQAARDRAAFAAAALLDVIAAARADGVPDDTPLMRTLKRAEPVVERIQARLDDWAHAAQINAVLRNRNVAQGGVMALGIFIALTEILPARFIVAVLLLLAGLVGWRVWGVLEIRSAIRSLTRALPLRVPAAAAS